MKRQPRHKNIKEARILSLMDIFQRTYALRLVLIQNTLREYENNIWSKCPNRLYSAAAPAVAVEWNVARNLQMMQNNLIMCYIYSHVSTYWRHPGYWKAFDEQRFCVISCLFLEHIFHFQFRNRAYCAKWTHFSFCFFHCCFKYFYTFRTLENNAIRLQYACCSVFPFSVTVTSSENGMVELFACGECPSAIALANQIRCCSGNLADCLNTALSQAAAWIIIIIIIKPESSPISTKTEKKWHILQRKVYVIRRFNRPRIINISSWRYWITRTLHYSLGSFGVFRWHLWRFKNLETNYCFANRKFSARIFCRNSIHYFSLSSAKTVCRRVTNVHVSEWSEMKQKAHRFHQLKIIYEKLWSTTSNVSVWVLSYFICRLL